MAHHSHILCFLLWAVPPLLPAQNIEFTPQFGLLTGVTAMAISPDGHYLATGCRDGNIIVWDTKYGYELHRFPGKGRAITSLGFAPDNSIFSSEGGSPLRFRSPGSPTGTHPGQDKWLSPIGTDWVSNFILEGSGYSESPLKSELVFQTSASGHFYVKDTGFGIEVYKIGTGEKSEREETKLKMKKGFYDRERFSRGKFIDTPLKMKMSHDEQYLVAGLEGKKTARAWKLDNEDPLREINLEEHRIKDIALSRNASHMAILTLEGGVQLWEVHSGKLLISLDHYKAIRFMAFSPSENILAFGTPEEIILWDYTTQAEQKRLESQAERFIFSNDGKTGYSYAWPSILKWEIATGKKLNYFFGKCPGIDKALFHPTENQLFVSGYGKILQVEMETWSISGVFDSHQGRIEDWVFSEDGHLLLSGSSSGELFLWDVDNKAVLHRYAFPGKGIKEVAISKDSLYIACLSKNNKIWAWEREETAPLNRYDAECQLGDIIFSADGRSIFGSCKYGLIRFNFLEGPEPEKVLWSIFWDAREAWGLNRENAETLFYNRDGKVKQLNVQTGKNTTLISDEQLFIGSINAFDLKRKRLYSFDSDDKLRSWDLQHGISLFSTQIPHRFVGNISVSPNGDYLSLVLLGRLKLFRLPRIEELGTFLLLGQGFHGVWITPRGYYCGPRDTGSGFIFTTGGKFYLMEQFDLKFNRPDIVINAFGSNDWDLIDAYYLAYQKRLEKMNISEDHLSEDFHTPEARIKNADELPFEVHDNKITLEIEAKDSLFLLDRIFASANDVPLLGQQGHSLKSKQAQHLNIALPVYLVPGENRIQVSVMNEKGAESFRETVIVYYSGEEEPDFYFVGIGASRFLHETLNLRYPAKDVGDLNQLFAKQEKEYRNYFSYQLVDEEVTIERVKALKDSLMQARPFDKVVLYISSHGLIDKKRDYYLATYDTDPHQPEKRGLSYAQLESLLDSIPPRYKLIMMDACHSGEYDKDYVKRVKAKNTKPGKVTFTKVGDETIIPNLGLENSFARMKELFADLRRNTGAIVIASAAGGEFAFEGEQWSNSVFVYCIREAYELGDTLDEDKNGKVTVTELQQYLEWKVPEYTDNRQRPTYRIENALSDFPIW